MGTDPYLFRFYLDQVPKPAPTQVIVWWGVAGGGWGVARWSVVPAPPPPQSPQWRCVSWQAGHTAAHLPVCQLTLKYDLISYKRINSALPTDGLSGNDFSASQKTNVRQPSMTIDSLLRHVIFLEGLGKAKRWDRVSSVYVWTKIIMGSYRSCAAL